MDGNRVLVMFLKLSDSNVPKSSKVLKSNQSFA